MKMYNSHKNLPRWVSEFFDRLTSPKDKQIVKRILERNDEMKDVYAEINKKMARLAPHVVDRMESFPHSLVGVWPYTHAQGMLSAIIDGAKYYNEKAARDTREERRTLNDLRKAVIKSTEKLIELLTRLEQIQERGRMSPRATTNVFDLIERAGRENLLFKSYIGPIIGQTRSFDPDKYYPNFKELLLTLIEEFKESTPGPNNLWDAAVFIHQKTSPADFIRYFLKALKELRRISSKKEGHLPNFDKMFDLSNKTVVVITQCALDLPNDSLSEDYVTKVKQSLKTEDF